VNQRLTRRDWILIAVCIALAAVSAAIVALYFNSAFPEASIDFRYDRNTSRPIAELVVANSVDLAGMKHAVRFETDNESSIFLERSLGLERANALMREKIRVFYWHHRWLRPLVEEEVSVDVAPTGEVVGYTHKIPEDRALPDGQNRPTDFLARIGVNLSDLQLVSQSERKLPKRIQRIYTYESRSIRPDGAPYRHIVTMDGALVTGYSQRLKIPDAWLRSYRELRSKNITAGSIDLIFMIATMIAAVVVFVVRLRRGDVPHRFVIWIGIATVILVGLLGLNSFPSELADYDTTTSYPAFIGWQWVKGAVGAVGAAMFLVIVCGAGEVLYRERLPQHLAMPKIWTKRALSSKRVFISLVLGYALVPLFIAYQVVFYLVARKFGAWAPAEIPYDDILNTAIPWVAVLFAGFYPAMSEEFLSRAFSIPFFQKIVRSRLFAIVLAGFIWGFGHATYPNQPFYIRGVEVGIAGVVCGLLMDRYGLLPLLIWHYTIDAVYTATLLFSSGNAYYITSAAISSLIFAVPLVVSIALYVRNRGFVPDDDLTNATMPVSPPPPHPEVAVAAAQFPPAIRVAPVDVVLCVVAMGAAAAAIAFRPPSTEDAVDYRISKERAKAVATAHLKNVVRQPLPERVIAGPAQGFRSWDRESGRDEGGTVSSFDSIAATYLVQHGMSVRELVRLFRGGIEAATYRVRFFTPMKKDELFVEVDPRTARVVGYQKLQDEQNAGPSLERDQALAVARRAFPTYGLDVKNFELKEALTFQQPKRRDWLFHFEERTPIAGRAFRRATARVSGGEVTQFSKNIKIPDSVYRDAATQTAFNLVLIVLKIAGVVAILAIIVTGLIVASRTRGLPWRRALRWTAILSVIPIAATVVRYESVLFNYPTSVAWDTFRIRLVTDFVRDAGLQIGVVFLALAGLEAAVPYAPSLITKEGRARFGRAAALAALTAVSMLVVAGVLMDWAAIEMPWTAQIGISVPSEVATALPALIEGGRAVLAAIILAAMVALYAKAIRKQVAAITISAIFLAMLDPGVSEAQAPLMLARAAIWTLVMWIVGRFILNGNPLAWPLAVFLAIALQTAATLMQNHRPDLLANGVALIGFAVIAILWAAAPRAPADA
jgi:membrane protease YdiL (CAAX protease family)